MTIERSGNGEGEGEREREGGVVVVVVVDGGQDKGKKNDVQEREGEMGRDDAKSGIAESFNCFFLFFTRDKNALLSFRNSSVNYLIEKKKL